VETIRGLGAELHFVGSGAPFFARGFRDEYQVPVPIYVDPERASYEALGLARTLRSTLNLRLLSNARRAAKAGFRQNSVEGDAWQQGGVLIVLPGGEVAYRYRSEVAGDHPGVSEVVEALRTAVQAA